MSQVAASTPPRPVTDYNARAAELKAELLKRLKGRAASATPPVTNTPATTKQVTHSEHSSLLRGSTEVPTTAAEEHGHELNVNELISQYSDSKPAANASVKQQGIPKEGNLAKVQQNPILSWGPAKSQANPSLGSPAKVAIPITNEQQSECKSTVLGNKQAGTDSLSEESEGEVREDINPPPVKPVLPAKPKETAYSTKAIRNDENHNPAGDGQIGDTPHVRVRNNSPPRRPPPPTSFNPQPLRACDDRPEDYKPQLDKRSYQLQHTELGRHGPNLQEPRDEEYRRPDYSIDLNRTEILRPARESKPPTLQDVLPLNQDLREWLEITGYHNAPYRTKILSRRRAIAALDAQREILLAEMEAEERAGIPPVFVGRVLTPSMLPPPPPNKTEPSFSAAGTAESNYQRDRSLSNKRPYSDGQREGPNAGKMARHEGQTAVTHVGDENDYEYRRPRSRDNEVARHPYDPRDGRDLPIGRYDSRARSRERDPSPARHVFESRAPARTRPYDEAFSDLEGFQEREKRPFEAPGGYRGRSFDPNYRGRGRGRVRSSRSDSRERDRDFHRDSETKNDSPLGSTITNTRPFKDPNGFDRGGKGGP
jgi:hypothetical protein